MENEIPDKWNYFEVMDRAYILCSQIDTALTNHPGLDKEHNEMVEKASELIGEIYQWAGRKLDEVTKNES